MKWLQEVLLDIAVSILIVLAVITRNHWLEIIVFVYTGLILFFKIVAFVNESFQKLSQRRKPLAPEWFIHILYGINTVAFLAFRWWIAAAAWAVIWLLSFLTQKKVDRMKKKKHSRRK